MSDRSPVRSEKARERTNPVTFYRQVVAELRKVVWPTQQQLVTYLIVVLFFVLVMIALRLVAGPRLRQGCVRDLRRLAGRQGKSPACGPTGPPGFQSLMR